MTATGSEAAVEDEPVTPRAASLPSPVFPRLWIEHITPVVDGGRYAVKRILGEPCEVAADILRHGHDVLAGRIAFRGTTPDVLPAHLQTGGRAAFRLRLVLAATLSPLYGIYSGYELCEATPLHPGSEEYGDSEKFELRRRAWSAPGNLNADLTALNRIRRAERALQLANNVAFHESEHSAILWYSKRAPGPDATLVIAVNLDPHAAQETMVHVPLDLLGVDATAPYEVEDLLSRERYVWRGARNYVRLDPTERVAQIFRVRTPGVS
jgi:starch synthase (maltosyl-transferring)